MSEKEGVGIHGIEDFWGVELSSKEKRVLWPENAEAEDDLEQTLELRQACLGVKAKDGERNVVQITAENDEGEEVTHTILSMRVGGTEQSQLFLTLNPPVTFELVAGSGPVHIVGTLNQMLSTLFESSSEEEEDEEEEEEELSSPEVNMKVVSKKRPATSPPQKPAKVPKLATKADAEMMDTSTSSQDLAKGKKTVKTARKEPEEEEDESEDEDEEDGDEESEEEDDSEEEDSEEEEEDESEEEEEEEKQPAKKPQFNGKLKGKSAKLQERAKQVAKTPQPSKPAKAAAKGTQSAPTTPKAGDKGSVKKGGKPVTNIEELKQKLTKMSPHLPKKFDKFNKLLTNNFKVNDSDVRKQLWEFVQKNQPKK